MPMGQGRNMIMPINNSMYVCLRLCVFLCAYVCVTVCDMMSCLDWAGPQLCSKSPRWLQHTLAPGLCPPLHSAQGSTTSQICFLHSNHSILRSPESSMSCRNQLTMFVRVHVYSYRVCLRQRKTEKSFKERKRKSRQVKKDERGGKK